MRELILFVIALMFLNCFSSQDVALREPKNEEYFDKVVVSKIEITENTMGGADFVKGVFKNKGDRVLTAYKIKIYFLDNNGSPIAEDEYSKKRLELKANYEDDFIFKSHNVPEKWFKGKKKYKIDILSILLETKENSEATE